jgi:hypothetical protein
MPPVHANAISTGYGPLKPFKTPITTFGYTLPEEFQVDNIFLNVQE